MKTTQPWDWLPPPPRARPRRFDIDHDATPPRRSWWGSPAGRKVANGVFRAGVSVFATAAIVVLSVVALGALFLLIAILKAAM